MKEEQMLYCLIAFILGWLVSRHMGNGFSVGAGNPGGTRCHPQSPGAKAGCTYDCKKGTGWFFNTGEYYCTCKDGQHHVLGC